MVAAVASAPPTAANTPSRALVPRGSFTGLPEVLGLATIQWARLTAAVDAPLRRELAHPGAVGGVGVAERVVVAEAGEMVVARVGVVALAVGKAVADRVVVVALDAQDAVVAQQRKDAVGVRLTSLPLTAEAVYRALCAAHGAPLEE